MTIFHTVYKTTNVVNNKIYIGVHSTKNINDSYLGSGVALKESIQKHGKESFVKEILFIFETKEAAFAKEKELVTEEFKNNSDTYNISAGGHSGPSMPGELNPMYGKTHSDETKQLISRTIKGKTGGIRSEYHRRRIIESNKTRILSETGKANRKKANQVNIQKAIEKSNELLKDPKFLAKRSKKCSETKLAQRLQEPKTKWFHKDHGTILANCQDIVNLDPNTKWGRLREIITGRYSNHRGWYISS